MATAWLTSFRGNVTVPTGGIAPQEPDLGTEALTLSSGSVQSAVIQDQCKLMRIVGDDDFHVEFGANPTATTTSMYIPADTPCFFGVNPGHKVAVVAA